MKALIAALNAKFLATPALTSVFTGNSALHWEVAPSGAAPPYLVAQVLSAPAESAYGGITFTSATVQFKTFAKANGTNSGMFIALTNMETFCGVFDELTLTLSSGTNVFTKRDAEPMAMRIPKEEETGGAEYQAVVQYTFAVDP